MERIVEILPAFDKRHSDPAKNYGVHGVEMRFLLKGDLGTVQFVLYTNWQLPAVQEWHESMAFDRIQRQEDNRRTAFITFHPMAADLGYHSPKPRYDGQTKSVCQYLPAGECYCDGSALSSHRVFAVMIEQGGEAMWGELQKYYDETFSETEKP